MKKTQINALKRIIKQNKYRTALQGMFEDADGCVIACNDYCVVRFTYYERPEEIPPANGISVEKFFNVTRGWDLALPTVDELKTIIRTANETKKPALYDFGEGLPCVNARYLLDMLRIFPDAKIYRTEKEPKNRAIFFDSPFGDGLLMPIRKQ